VNNLPPGALNYMIERSPGTECRPRSKAGAASTLVTERDREMLAFIAEHRFVLAGHVQTLLGVSESVAYRRLGVLTTKGLLDHTRVLHGQPGWYQITRAGLALIASDLPPPRMDLRSYAHDIGVAWLRLAATGGTFGLVERAVSERTMRSVDAARTLAAVRGERRVEISDDQAPPFGVRLGGLGPRGVIRLHYPDLLLIGPRDERVAIELELSAKGRRRLETILAGYGAEPRIAAVLYLADKATIRREVRRSAARLGLSELVHVQGFMPAAAGRPPGPKERTRSPAAIMPSRARHPTARAPAR